MNPPTAANGSKLAGSQADVGFVRLHHVRKYAIPITMMMTIVIVTFTNVMKLRYVSS
jgi:hypothetical protein